MLYCPFSLFRIANSSESWKEQGFTEKPDLEFKSMAKNVADKSFLCSSGQEHVLDFDETDLDER